MTTIYFVRHGQKEHIAGDPSLTPTGREQAKHTAKFLKDKQIMKIFASPFKRTMETAKIIAKELGLKIKTDNRLTERINWGDKKGESFRKFWEEWQKTGLDRDYQPNHGFSSRESGRRLESFLRDTLKNLNDNDAILIVAHGGIIEDLLFNIFPERDLPLTTNKISKAKYIEILECSVTMLKKDSDYILRKIGDTSHLPVSLVTLD
jgi:2,3-bisphosphoglycerate-dependent phosphoglycerate mutase